MNFLLVNLAISDMIVGVFSTFRLVIIDSISAFFVSPLMLDMCLHGQRYHARFFYRQASVLLT